MQPTNIDHAAVRNDWAERGFSCDLWIDPPAQVWHDFEHDVDHLALLIEGMCQVEMEGRTVRLTGGDELLVPAGTRHTVRNYGDRPARWLHGFRGKLSSSQQA